MCQYKWVLQQENILKQLELKVSFNLPTQQIRF